jgi:hypothetical protein
VVVGALLIRIVQRWTRTRPSTPPLSSVTINEAAVKLTHTALDAVR